MAKLLVAMRRRDYLISGVALSVGIAGCGDPEAGGPSDDIDDEDTETDVETDTPADTHEDEDEDAEEDAEEAPDVDDPDPITFEGSGQAVTDEFDLLGGFVRAEMEHTGGESNFQVELVDEETGDMVGLFANVIGEWSGVVGETIDEGSYILDINADGDWSVELQQPRPTEGEEPPIDESGDTSTVLGPYELDGRIEATGSHDGDGNFIVRALDAEATGDVFGELIFNEIGEFEGTTSFAGGDRVMWIAVEADGGWEVALE